jgi:hypothetical protein
MIYKRITMPFNYEKLDDIDLKNEKDIYSPGINKSMKNIPPLHKRKAKNRKKK